MTQGTEHTTPPCSHMATNSWIARQERKKRETAKRVPLKEHKLRLGARWLQVTRLPKGPFHSALLYHHCLFIHWMNASDGETKVSNFQHDIMETEEEVPLTNTLFYAFWQPPKWNSHIWVSSCSAETVCLSYYSTYYPKHTRNFIWFWKSSMVVLDEYLNERPPGNTTHCTGKETQLSGRASVGMQNQFQGSPSSAREESSPSRAAVGVVTTELAWPMVWFSIRHLPFCSCHTSES